MRYCTYRNAPRQDVGAIKYTTAMVDTMVLSLAFLDAGAQCTDYAARFRARR